MPQQRQYRQQIVAAFAARRLRRRFERIEQRLRTRDVSALPSRVQVNRTRLLDALHQYAARGVFPRNTDYPDHHRPTFVDHAGRVCAVGHLLVESGRSDLARSIVATQNLAYVREMQVPELAEWAADSGFTLDELATIQPSYPCVFDAAKFTLNAALQGWLLISYVWGVLALTSIGEILLSWLRKRPVSRFAIAAGVVASIGLLVASFGPAWRLWNSGLTLPQKLALPSWATCPPDGTFVRLVTELLPSGYNLAAVVIAVLTLGLALAASHWNRLAKPRMEGV